MAGKRKPRLWERLNYEPKPLLSEEAIWSQPGRMRRTGRIYFVESGVGGPIKIGYAANPATRVMELQCGNPAKLYLLAIARGTIRDEGALHKRFAATHVSGEWFAPCEELWALIQEHWCYDSRHGERDPATEFRALLGAP